MAFDQLSFDSVSPTVPAGPRANDQLGKYRLLELIGSGAMGDVYRAEHVLLGRRVAVKVLRSELARERSLVERFFSEALAVNLVGHPHIVEVTDFAREPDGTVWFVMEFLEGCDLGSLLRHEGKLGVVEPGAFADLIVIDGNPLKKLELFLDQGAHLPVIMKAGKFHKNALK